LPYFSEFTDALRVLQGHTEWKKLKTRWPPYIDELDRMFMGVAVDGSTSFVPGQSTPYEDITSEDEEDFEEDEGDQLTPLSSGSKRTSSTPNTRSTTTSPKKKVKSPAVRDMVEGMKDFNVNAKDRTVVVVECLTLRRKDKEDDRAAKMELCDRIARMARDCGVTEANSKLWVGVLKLLKDEVGINLFLVSNTAGRNALIQSYARVNN
jgi:hypothetical protein